MQRSGLVALAGRPNSGKSTFLNHILGEKISIVSDRPQTTRNRILGVFHREALQIGFLDLPGIHKPRFKMNRRMMKEVRQGLEDADLVLHFIDASVPSGSGDRFVKEFLATHDLPVILVLNKLDLVNKTKIIPLIERLYQDFKPVEIVPISALTGENIERLLELVASLLPEGGGLFPEDELTNQPLRFMAAEFIREKALHYTREEIPHAVAVTLEQFRLDSASDQYLVDAVIWVERVSQRKIILGAQGKKIRQIRLAARRALKGLLGKPVSLEIFVKVREKWRDQDQFLDDLGSEIVT